MTAVQVTTGVLTEVPGLPGGPLSWHLLCVDVCVTDVAAAEAVLRSGLRAVSAFRCEGAASGFVQLVAEVFGPDPDGAGRQLRERCAALLVQAGLVGAVVAIRWAPTLDGELQQRRCCPQGLDLDDVCADCAHEAIQSAARGLAEGAGRLLFVDAEQVDRPGREVF